MNEDFTIKPNCDMLIAQNCFIGNDPVGYSCHNEADYNNETHFFCKSCREKLPINRGLPPLEKITIPERGSVIGWEERMKKMMQELMGNVNKNDKLPFFITRKQ